VHFQWITDCRLYVIDHIAKHRKECRSDSAVRKESMPQGRLKHIPPVRVEITRRHVLGIEIGITPVSLRSIFKDMEEYIR